MSPSFPTRRSSVLDARPVTLVATYMVAGTSYTPADIVDYDAVGYASRYGDGRAGQPTANGERFDPDAISAAHKTLPLPSYVEVTALDTGRSEEHTSELQSLMRTSYAVFFVKNKIRNTP